MNKDKILETVIYKDTYMNIPYNYQINRRNNCDVVYVLNNLETRTLFKSEDNIINYKEKLSAFGKDHNIYRVYNIKKDSYTGYWGGNITLQNDDCSDYRLFIKSTFSFHIEFSNRIIKLLTDNQNAFDLRYIINIIRTKINTKMLVYIEDYLKKNSLDNLQYNKYEYVKELLKDINHNVLYLYGIWIDEMNIDYTKENMTINKGE